VRGTSVNSMFVNGREMNAPHSRTRRDDRSHGDSSPTVRVGCVDFMGAARSFRAYPFTAVVVALLCAVGVFGSHALAHAAIGSRCAIWVEFSPGVQP
jgi:hypothetical protein